MLSLWQPVVFVIRNICFFCTLFDIMLLPYCAISQLRININDKIKRSGIEFDDLISHSILVIRKEALSQLSYVT